MSVTRLASSWIVSWSETSEMPWRNVDSEGSSAVSWNSRATPTSSCRFSSRPSASIVRSACSASTVPLRSSTRSSSCGTESSCAADIRVSIITRNELTALAGAAPTPASSGLASASQRAMPMVSAWARSLASDVSPMPRRGRFAMRESEIASAGLSITCR